MTGSNTALKEMQAQAGPHKAACAPPRPLELALIRRERQLAILLHANRQLSVQRSPRALLRVLLEAAAELTGASAGCAGLVEGQAMHISQMMGDGVPRNASRRIAPGEGTIGSVLVTGAIFSAVASAEAPPDVTLSAPAPDRHVLCVPIAAADGRLLGCFEMYDASSCRAENEGDASILLGLASMAATALENGRMLNERQEAKREQETATSLLSATLESTMDGIMAVDANGDITAVNRRFVDMWGIGEEIVAGGDSTEVLVSVLGEVKEPVEFFELVTELYWNPGRESRDVVELQDGRFLERFSKPQYREGKVVGRIWTFHDITELKRLQAQLLQAQKMEAIGTLAGGIAHDFNNIMTVIKGYAGLLMSELNPPPPFDRFLHNIDEASHRAAALIRSLLAYSRKETAHSTTAVDCNLLVQKLGDFLSRLIGEHIELVTTPAAEQLTIQADRGQIEQVLVNLCTNARDAMPGGGRIAVSVSKEFVGGSLARHGKKEGSYAVIAVSDNGCGMDQETLQRIFEPFFTTKEVGSGTGLGLSISYGIAKQHGGFLEVQSDPGKGTVFSLYLPLEGQDGGDLEQEQRVNTEPSSERAKSETILLVEDNLLVRNLLTDVLHRDGYHIIEAVDGVDGVEKFLVHRQEIDLVVMDVLMPRENGMEASRQIRAAGGDAPIIFISGYTGDTIDRKTLLREGAGFLSKPIKPQRLLKKVREVLDELQAGNV